jgi:hypothetical protein
MFPDDMGLDSNVELALANLDLNEPVLEILMMGILLRVHPPRQQMHRLHWI